MFLHCFFMEKWNCREDIIYLTKHLAKLLDADFDKRVSEIGLTAAQARVLFYINRMNHFEQEEVHQNNIEKEFCLAKSTVNGLISRLLKTGYIVKKNVHPYSVLEITQEGVDAIGKIKQGRIDVINKLFSGYTEEERKITLEKFNKLIDNLEGGDEDVAKD